MKSFMAGLLIMGSNMAFAQPNSLTTSSMRKASEALAKIHAGPEITTKKTNLISLFAKTNPPTSTSEKAPIPEQR